MTAVNIPTAINQLKSQPWGAEITARFPGGTARVRKDEHGRIWVRRQYSRGGRMLDQVVFDPSK